MIFHTKAEAVQRVVVGTDEFGNEVFEDHLVPFRAEVRPLPGSETVGDRVAVVTRFRLFYPRTLTLTASAAVTVAGLKYEVEGEPEPHTHHGRVHHYEAIVKRVTG